MLNLAIILAVAENGAVGLRGGLPWHIPEDLRRFRSLTIGHTVIMGRGTHACIGGPLPGRKNVVVTRSPAVPGCLAVPSLVAAVEAAEGRAFVIGGPRLWREAWPVATRLHLTRVPGRPEADVFFGTDLAGWSLAASDRRPTHAFLDYVRP